jgi:protein SCO1/2
MPRIPHRTLALSGILVALVLFLYFQDSSRNEHAIGGTELIPSQKIGEFNLVDVYGQPFRKADVLDKWTVLSFGFTHCPDVCPVTLAAFRDELNALPLNSRNRIQFVFITVDPERDTPEVLKKYVQAFHTAIRPVTGNLDDIKHFAGLINATFAKEGQGEVGLYTMAHSPQYFVINPEGEWQAVYTPPLAKGRLAQDLKSLSRHKRFGIF